jgi:hypothetical protein
MKNLRPLVLALLPMYLFAQSHLDKAVSSEWKNIEQTNFSISYPGNWELNESGQTGTKFVVLSPLESVDDKLRENVNLLTQDVSAYNIDLEQFAKISENQIKAMITDAEVIESKTLSANNRFYHMLIYKGKQGQYSLEFIQYYFVIQGIAYVVTFTAEQDKFDKFKAIGEKILNSFVIKQ